MTQFSLIAEDTVQATPELLSLLRKVNAEVNSFRYVEDMKQYGTIDYWTAKIDEARGGDCDDYSLTKRKRLMEAGVPYECLFPTICHVRGEGHLVLVVRTSEKDYVLDNMEKQVTPIDKLNYDWHARLNPVSQKWELLGA